MASAKPLPPPPRTLNVQKFAESRAPELESLQSIVSARLNNDFRTGDGKRRRTTSHRTAKNRRRKRRKLDPSSGSAPDAPASDKDPKKPSRRVRRKKELQANPASGFCSSGDGTRRLRTHLWHAKRFTMVKRWGFHLPLGLLGRGKGSRAVLKWLKTGALVHDNSYCLPIAMEGPEDSILAILKMVLLPSPLGALDISEEQSKAVYCGVCYGNAMLYHVGTPLSKFIAPIMFMWRPFSRSDNHMKFEEHLGPTGCATSSNSECRSPFRYLWIWIHAAAFKEGFDELRFACQKQKEESGASVNCFSLEGHITKLEIMGSRAIQVLQKILHPAPECNTFDSVAFSNSEVQKSVIDHADKLPSHTTISLTVHDPRELPSMEINLVAETPSGPDNCMQNKDIQENGYPSGVSTTNADAVLSLWSKLEVHGVLLSDCESLWDSSNKLYPPKPDHVLSRQKNNRRLDLFNLDLPNYARPTIETEDAYGRTCSLLLMKHKDIGNLGTRWSIILPLSWLKVFWISLVSHGAHAIGLRERRWVSSDNGLPSFPFDFPDCRAYSLFMDAEAIAFDKEAELRPLAVRPSRVPIPPPWDCLISTVMKGQGIIRDFQTQDVKHIGGEIDATVNCQNVESPSLSEEAGASFPGFVIRPSNVFHNCPETAPDMHLLVFPNMKISDICLSELIDKRTSSWFDREAISMTADVKLCFVRVMLHAYKEGVFEEGAIVCAPILKDLSQWASRSDDDGKLQIPPSSIRSLFAQQDSGRWELHVPKSCSALQSYRWPIGFVTTGFVRGSPKPLAQAVCEAKLLSLLRWQQWSQTQTAKPEIFVLVRNPRSTAYRRALATIVLEQQKEDLEFM